MKRSFASGVQISTIADAMESRGQGMLQETTDELDPVDGSGFELFGIAIFDLDTDLVAFDGENASVRLRRPPDLPPRQWASLAPSLCLFSHLIVAGGHFELSLDNSTAFSPFPASVNRGVPFGFEAAWLGRIFAEMLRDDPQNPIVSRRCPLPEVLCIWVLYSEGISFFC